MSASAQARWLVIAAIVLLDAAGMGRAGMHLAWPGLARAGAAVLLLAAVAAVYARRGRSERLADLAHTAAQLVAFTAAAGVFSYVVTATGLPLHDAELAAVDRALGFDWPGWFAWVAAHPWFHAVLRLAYASALLQAAAILLYLALTGQALRNAELLWAVMLSILVIVPLSGVLPAVSAAVHYGITPPVEAVHLPEFTALRAGQLHELDLGRLEGVINFPSFHTTLGVLYAWALRGRRASLAAGAALNAAMILAVPSEGGHYLVDAIAGAAVAVAAIRAAARIEATLGAAPPRPAAAGAD